MAANREETEAAKGGRQRVQTAGESRTRGSRGNGRSRAQSSRRPASKRRSRPVSNRPNANLRPGGGAKILAPIALIVFALAVFGVLSTSGEPSGNGGSTPSKSVTTKKSTTTANGTTVTTKATYTVKAGDSFAAIAQSLNLDVDKLKELNPDVDPQALQPGEKLKLR